MKVFISWGGEQSRAIAEALNDWLPMAIQAVEPFYSPDIEKGAKWSNELDVILEESCFGIVCLTADNLLNHWIHYETGALSKTKDAMIWTLLCGIKHTDVPPPLSKFQHTTMERVDFFKMLESINKQLSDVGDRSLKGNVLLSIFETNWPRLEERLKTAKAPKRETEGVDVRSERDILNEILEVVRGQDGRISALENEVDTSQQSFRRRRRRVPIGDQPLKEDIAQFPVPSDTSRPVELFGRIGAEKKE